VGLCHANSEQHERHICPSSMSDGVSSPQKGRVSLKLAEEVLRLYGEKHADLNVRHFRRARWWPP